MFVIIYIPFTKSIFDIISTHPDNCDDLSDQEYYILFEDYLKNLQNQYIIEANNWSDKYIKSKYYLVYAENSGNEEIKIGLQLK